MPTAYVVITCDLGHEAEVIRAITNLKGVQEAKGTFGVYDIVVKVVADSMESLRDTITYEMTRIPNIRSKITLIVIEGQGQDIESPEYR
jgi:DNA-binding Lrp family transcriptional regulator